jgi:hypothetical protein
MKIEWKTVSKLDFDLFVNRNVRYATMEVEGFTDDRVEVFMNLSEPGFTVVLITDHEYRSAKRETYAGALSIATQVATSILMVRESITATRPARAGHNLMYIED